MIRIEHITKSFGYFRALKDVHCEINEGEFVSLLGANGAGKTTLIRILATLAKPSEGDVWIGDVSLKKHPMKIRSRIGVVSHFTYLYNDLSALENLRFFARMYLIADARPRIEALLTDVGLAPRQHDLVRTFSRGMQQRLALAKALLHRPNILLLDEPFTGLDINAAGLLKELLQRLVREEVTVLLTSHDIDFALDYSQRILLLKNGELTIDIPSASADKNDILRILGDK